MSNSTKEDIWKCAAVLLGAAAIFAYNIIDSIINH
jgi:hypothetical protein